MKHHNQYTIHTFIPLIVLTSIILLFVVARQIIHGIHLMNGMYDFMAGFFILFSLFKIINLNSFARSYAMYDLLARQWYAYGYIYPFIELILGIAYLTRFHLEMANWITFALMIISSAGVYRALREKRELDCACLGTVLKLPMTYVTLAEDILMGLMALAMILL